jgi:hypothetical protein
MPLLPTMPKGARHRRAYWWLNAALLNSLILSTFNHESRHLFRNDGKGWYFLVSAD